MSSLDEDTVLNDYIRTLVEASFKAYSQKSKEKIIFHAPCKMVQLFETFFGFLVIKNTKMVEFVPVVNKTKEVHTKIPLQEFKYVNDHRYMFQDVGLEFFVHNSNESYLLVFDNLETRKTVKEIITKNSPKIM